MINEILDKNDDINPIYKNNNYILKNTMNIRNKHFNKTKKSLQTDLDSNLVKNFNKIDKKNNSNKSNIINNYIIKKYYKNDDNKSINDAEDINIKIVENNIQEVPNYNTRQIKKSKSYFIEANTLNNGKNNNYINYINAKTNYKKNVNTFNQKNRIENAFKNKNNKSFKQKVYRGLENNGYKYLKNSSSESNSFESISLDELINKVNYNGDKKNFPKYIEELKLKADITTIVQNMFKNELNSYDGLDKFLDNYYKKKNKKIISMYKYLLERLLQINQNRINDKEINSFYDEIYYSKQ